MGGNRAVKWKWYYNLFITFVISGFWHGAKWSFVIWGAFHGLLLVLEIIFKMKEKPQNKWTKYFRITLTFSLVCLGWIFFRANNLEEACYIISNMFVNIPEDIHNIYTNTNFTRSRELYLNQDKSVFIISILSIGLLELVHLFQRHQKVRKLISNQFPVIRWSFYYLIVLMIISFGSFNKSQFIYFQF